MNEIIINKAYQTTPRKNQILQTINKGYPKKIEVAEIAHAGPHIIRKAINAIFCGDRVSSLTKSAITKEYSMFYAVCPIFDNLRYLLSSLFSRMVLPTQAENILPALGEPAVKRERTTNNAKS